MEPPAVLRCCPTDTGLVDYGWTDTDTAIAEVHVSDTMATTPASSIVHSPEAVPGKEITVETSSWLLPQSGVAFTWATNDELPQTKQPEVVASSERASS